MTERTLKQTKHQMISQFVYKQTQPSHVTKAAGIEVFFTIPKNVSALARTNRLVKGSFLKIKINPRALLN